VTAGNLTTVTALDYGTVTSEVTTPAQQRAAATRPPPSAVVALVQTKVRVC